MKIRYRVASVSAGPMPVKATIGGREVDVMAEGVTLDLVSLDGSMAHTFRFLTGDDAAAQELNRDDVVSLTIALEQEDDGE